ncbi:MAG TPA: FAD-binding oxidoreductase [Bryobacteraceae bacterium]|nr:FAD-binding oxidoreductase [Bryobacteraceae bacterium]
MIHFEAALRDWAAAVGDANVIIQAAALRAAETATFATNHEIPAILRPAGLSEVQECLRIANRHRIPVYPISSGRNWGYGSRVPASDGCVLLDLGRINRIVDFNEELGYVTVEPGVTQAQLYEFLRQRNSKLWMDSTGASPHCSLIGNAVERGFGHTPYGDHFAHTCGLEVVLPTGAVIETGFGRFAGANATPVYRWGVGPAFDGLFSQSNFGVVTRMTLWLMPAPEYFQAYYFRCEEPDGVGGIIDALRPLRLNGTIRSASHIANDYKVLSALRQYPWEETGGRTPLDGAMMSRFRRDLKIGPWNGSGALYGTKGQVKEARRLLRKALRGVATRLEFLDDRKLKLASLFAKPYQWVSGWDLRRTLAVLKPVYGLMKGIPTDHPLASTYWRKRQAPPEAMDPDRDGCGLLWCSPVAPGDGASLNHLTSLVSGLVLDHGFEPAISLTMITERAVACIISIAYDREVQGEDERAMACYKHLVQELERQGYYSYRLSIGMMSAMGEPGDYTNLMRDIKQVLDPAGILAPGRYVPAESHASPVREPAHAIAECAGPSSTRLRARTAAS